MQHKLYKERRFFELASEGSAAALQGSLPTWKASESLVNLSAEGQLHSRNCTGLGYHDLLSAVSISRGTQSRRFGEQTAFQPLLLGAFQLPKAPDYGGEKISIILL